MALKSDVTPRLDSLGAAIKTHTWQVWATNPMHANPVQEAKVSQSDVPSHRYR